MSSAQEPDEAGRLLKTAADRLTKMPVLVGLDGFVDTILHVVAQRESARRYVRMTRMADFARRVEAAAGFSANLELVPQMVKLGGNGPIMANALHALGAPVTYVGNLGAPHLHPVFQEFAKKVRVISLAEPGYTDAIEFEDGKLMCGKLTSLAEVTWPALLAQLPLAKLRRTFARASLIALVNWTMLPHLGAILQKLLFEVAPELTGEKRWLFFDLADPAKRTPRDLLAVVKLIARFQPYFRVIFGLNLQESRQVGDVLGIALDGESPDAVSAHAARLQARLGVETVAIHPTTFAVAADAAGSAVAVGPFIAAPKIHTGAGDHFNAGFCTGRLLGASLEASLRLGVGTSGYYVRTARSPQLEELRRFLQRF